MSLGLSEQAISNRVGQGRVAKLLHLALRHMGGGQPLGGKSAAIDRLGSLVLIDIPELDLLEALNKGRLEVRVVVYGREVHHLDHLLGERELSGE